MADLTLANVPLVHGEQVLAPPSEYVPPAQLSQVEAPLSEYLPLSQSEHSADELPLYVPDEHVVQLTASPLE